MGRTLNCVYLFTCDYHHLLKSNRLYMLIYNYIEILTNCTKIRWRSVCANGGYDAPQTHINRFSSDPGRLELESPSQLNSKMQTLLSAYDCTSSYLGVPAKCDDFMQPHLVGPNLHCWKASIAFGESVIVTVLECSISKLPPKGMERRTARMKRGSVKLSCSA